MNVKERRKTHTLPHRRSDKLNLSVDARIIVALGRNQPQQRDQLIKDARIDRSSFYRNIRLLTNRGIVKETTKGYALWDFCDLEEKVGQYFKTRKEWQWSQTTLSDVANEVGATPGEIEQLAYQYGHKYGVKIGPKITREADPEAWVLG